MTSDLNHDGSVDMSGAEGKALQKSFKETISSYAGADGMLSREELAKACLDLENQRLALFETKEAKEGKPKDDGLWHGYIDLCIICDALKYGSANGERTVIGTPKS